MGLKKKGKFMIIGLAGSKGSGKDTFAKLCVDIINEEEGHLACVQSWAYLLKKSAAATLGIDIDDINSWADSMKNEGQVEAAWYDDSDNVVTISGREFLQNYGTEAHREIFGKDFWVNAFWEENDEAALNIVDVMFIADTRFENEAQSIKDRGGIVLRIDRGLAKSNDTHASELGLPGELIDIVVDNNGTLYELEQSARTFVNSIKTLKVD